MKNSKYNKSLAFKNTKLLASVIVFLSLAIPVSAASPSGADTFQLLANPWTGADNTGDGGTGLPADLNYYYVGQTMQTQMEIKSGGTTSSNIWVDYNSQDATASALTDGSYFNTYSGQTIDPTATGPTGGRVYLTGSEIPVVSQSGTGNFGRVSWTMNRPTAAAYGLGAPETLDINVGVIGATTESNISLAGADLLDDEEDFSYHIWADTRKPFAENPAPADGANPVAVESLYTFDLRDTLNGEGDNSGVGTGINTSTPPGVLTFDDGGGQVDYTAWDSYACSGTWGTNLCTTTVNPPSPLGIAGDNRNWEYSTLYTVDISGYQDLASASQDQLGDANGPNTMNAKSWTFTTEPDVVPPEVTSETPVRGSVNVSVSTNLTIEIEDRKTYPGGVSGTGVVSNTCKINVSSASFPLDTFIEGDAEVVVAAIPYGYRFTIDPTIDFGQNELVSISVYDCQDVAGNTMVTDNYTFTTSDTDPPYIDTIAPADDAAIAANGTVSFHIHDDGVGVDINNTVIYVNGIYYTNGGGAGSVTTNGTRITFATSLDFNGGNYIGDTTSLAGASDDYTFLIDPEVDFVAGEAVPVIVYARDTSNNLMEREVWAMSLTGGVCPAGSTFCGANTSWNGTSCVGTSSGSGGTTSGCGGGSALPPLSINLTNLTVTQIDEHSVLVSWYSTLKGSARVLYDVVHRTGLDNDPNFGFPYSTIRQEDDSVYHGVVVDSLTTGTLYYFRPATEANGHEVIGEEVKMAPVFATRTVEAPPVVCEQPEPAAPQTQPTRRQQPPQQILSPLQIIQINQDGNVVLDGKGIPNTTLNIRIF